MIINTDSLTPMERGRVRKTLEVKHIAANGSIATLGEYLREHNFTRKSTLTEYVSQHKHNGCYEPLSTPKVSYVLWDEGIGINVPKIIYDLVDLPETISHGYNPDVKTSYTRGSRW
jgi:hypothetical protein